MMRDCRGHGSFEHAVMLNHTAAVVVACLSRVLGVANTFVNGHCMYADCGLVSGIGVL